MCLFVPRYEAVVTIRHLITKFTECSVYAGRRVSFYVPAPEMGCRMLYASLKWELMQMVSCLPKLGLLVPLMYPHTGHTGATRDAALGTTPLLFTKREQEL